MPCVFDEFGAASTFGVGAAADPFTRLCRAECMLALLILHGEGGDVDFIDEDRLEVLRDAPASEAFDALKAALSA